MKKIIGKTEYEIINLIAQGGMGSVYKARAKGVEGFEKTVAIKTMLPKLAGQHLFVDRFIAEAKLVANLIHENIVQIYQLSKTRGIYYFVLEYVDGISLFDFMEFHRKLKCSLPIPLAVFIVSRIARGLAYAHSRKGGDGKPLNIVHCDVCPHNILINVEGVPKLTDFGIARAGNLEGSGTVSGKVAFMSPEQASGNCTVDFRSDIYSLGIVLFYLLSNKMARHIEKSIPEILEEARNNQILWERLPEDLPPELRWILEKMLSRDPAERYTDTATLARELEYFIYKDGYGPTIVTLAEYMKELLPARFGGRSVENEISVDKTAIFSPEAAEGETRIMTPEELAESSLFSSGSLPEAVSPGKTDPILNASAGSGHLEKTIKLSWDQVEKLQRIQEEKENS